MDNQKMTYQERVKKCMHILFDAYWSADGDGPPPGFNADDPDPELYAQAIATVSMQAEAISAFAHSAFTGSYSSHAGPLSEKYLQEHGYVEPLNATGSDTGE